MKKMFALLMLCCFALVNYTQATVVNVGSTDTIVSTVTTVDTATNVSSGTLGQVERLVDKYGGKIGDVISSLAGQLKVPAEHVYGVFTKQYVAEGAIGASVIGIILLLFLTLMIIFAICYRLGKRKYNALHKDSYYKYAEENSGVVNIVGFCISALFFLITLIVLCCNLQFFMQIMNPEYYVIKEIMSLVK